MELERIERRKEQKRVEEELERLGKERETLGRETAALETELGRMQTTLETLVEAVPQTQGGRTLTEEQKTRYAELKSEFDVQAHELLQTSEEKRREQETLNVRLKQKGELIASHRQELGNTRVRESEASDE